MNIKLTNTPNITLARKEVFVVDIILNGQEGVAERHRANYWTIYYDENYSVTQDSNDVTKFLENVYQEYLSEHEDLRAKIIKERAYRDRQREDSISFLGRLVYWTVDLFRERHSGLKHESVEHIVGKVPIIDLVEAWLSKHYFPNELIKNHMSELLEELDKIDN